MSSGYNPNNLAASLLSLFLILFIILLTTFQIVYNQQPGLIVDPSNRALFPITTSSNPNHHYQLLTRALQQKCKQSRRKQHGGLSLGDEERVGEESGWARFDYGKGIGEEDGLFTIRGMSAMQSVSTKQDSMAIDREGGGDKAGVETRDERMMVIVVCGIVCVVCVAQIQWLLRFVRKLEKKAKFGELLLMKMGRSSSRRLKGNSQRRSGRGSGDKSVVIHTI